MYIVTINHNSTVQAIVIYDSQNSMGLGEAICDNAEIDK